jgi:hypothetical protein
LWRLLASLKLAVLLIIILALVLAAGTFLEAARGREYTSWHVYGRSWFVALWGLLGVNVLAAALIRFPWKVRQAGFLIAHLGILVLLAGALLTYSRGLRGQLSFEEGETTDSILISGRSQITVVREGKHGQRSAHFAFSAGPEDWPAGETADLGTEGGVRVKVLEFYRHARRTAGWVADKSGRGGPALKLDLAGPDGRSAAQGWLPTDQFSPSMFAGPVRLQLNEVSDDSMLQDFREPPAEEAAEDGVLSMHYEGQMHRVPVHEKAGQKVPVGESGILVEIVEYLPNAKPGPKVRFTSQGDEPKNPLLELMVHLPGEEKPIRQLAFAKDPFLTLDGVHGRRCPVRFWYHHPAVSPQDGADLLQTPDGKLHCRVAVDGRYQWRGEVKQGDTIESVGDSRLSILKYLPHARQEMAFQPVDPAAEESQVPEAAALVEVIAPGTQPLQTWLSRADQMYGFHRFQTPQGPLLVTLGYEYHPLDFSLKLLDFRRGMNPGNKGNASFSSSVQLVDSAKGFDQKREISMNRPLSHGKYSFYQSSFEELPDGRQASILSVAYDPGRLLKYSGCLMICVGTFVMFYMRGPLGRRKPPAASQNRTTDTNLLRSSDSPVRSAPGGPSSVTHGPTGTGRARGRPSSLP